MAWQINSKGSFAQVIGAVVAITPPSNSVDRAALTLAQAYMSTLLLSPPAQFANHQISLRAFGVYDGNCLRFEMQIDGIDGVLDGQIINTPDKLSPALPT